MKKKNLILTVLHGYDYPFVEPFFRSLKQVGYDGELVVFASDKVSRATKAKARSTGAILIDYRDTYPFIDSYRIAFDGIRPTISINNYRFLLYLQYLRFHPGEYSMVMLTDIRDVVFQKKPFPEEHCDQIFFFLEDSTQTFQHRFNRQWLADATNIAVADRLSDEPVSCAGVTIGSEGRVLSYLDYLKNKLAHREKLEWGLDQGIHNAYIYVDTPPAMRVFSSEEGYVVNLGAYQPYQLNPHGEVVTSKGTAYAIVHQYDRSGKLFEAIKRKYIGRRLVQKLKRLYFLLMP
jgi:hypothetical protein